MKVKRPSRGLSAERGYKVEHSLLDLSVVGNPAAGVAILAGKSFVARAPEQLVVIEGRVGRARRMTRQASTFGQPLVWLSFAYMVCSIGISGPNLSIPQVLSSVNRVWGGPILALGGLAGSS